MGYSQYLWNCTQFRLQHPKTEDNLLFKKPHVMLAAPYWPCYFWFTHYGKGAWFYLSTCHWSHWYYIVHNSDHQNLPQNCYKLKRLKKHGYVFKHFTIKICFFLFQGHKEKLNAIGGNNPQSRVVIKLWELRCTCKELWTLYLLAGSYNAGSKPLKAPV